MATSASLGQSQERADSLCQLLDQSRLENSGDDAEADANSGSSNVAHVRQPLSRESSCVGQTPEAGEGRDSPATKEADVGETARQLRERLIALEKEVLQPRQPEHPTHIYNIHITNISVTLPQFYRLDLCYVEMVAAQRRPPLPSTRTFIA